MTDVVADLGGLRAVVMRNGVLVVALYAARSALNGFVSISQRARLFAGGVNG